MLSDAELLHYNHLGLIPGPEETEEEFVRRCRSCTESPEKLQEQLPFKAEAQRLEGKLRDEVFAETERLYDIAPDRIPLFYSNYRLMPWQGACAWIFRLTPDSPRSALLQMRKKRIPGYSAKELIAHEAAHIGRMCFDEPKFEEMFAYRSASYRWRRVIGPIVESQRDVFIALLLLFAMIGCDAYIYATEAFDLQWVATGLRLAFFALCGIAAGRLLYRRRVFRNAARHLLPVIQEGKTPEQLMYRLRDDEIARFARMAPSDIIAYADREKELSLRWRLLAMAYVRKKGNDS